MTPACPTKRLQVSEALKGLGFHRNYDATESLSLSTAELINVFRIPAQLPAYKWGIKYGKLADGTVIKTEGCTLPEAVRRIYDANCGSPKGVEEIAMQGLSEEASIDVCVKQSQPKVKKQNIGYI
jgi:hypothetical protein